jgi:hypothetical protein
MDVVEYGVLAFAAVQAPADALTRLRHNPGPSPGPTWPANFLRHADEQTVVGFAAVLQAIQTYRLQDWSFREWGVVAAPRFIGRLAGAGAMNKYLREGARSTSPHLIPHQSLHAVSGAISVALQMHGPNCGVGGGSHAVSEGLLAACTVLDAGDVPGLWLVVTQWEPEPMPDEQGRSTLAGLCHGVALALVPQPPNGTGLRLRYHWDAAALAVTYGPATVGQQSHYPDVPSLANFLARLHDTPTVAPWICAARGAGQLELTACGSGRKNSCRAGAGDEDRLEQAPAPCPGAQL